MSTSSRLTGLLLVTSALVSPAIAHAQSASVSPPQSEAEVQANDQQPQTDAQSIADAEQSDDQSQPDISIPGGAGDIVIVGRTSRNVVRTSTEVTTVLSSADIARTGEGDIAGALSRVTGLSVVGNGFVYVRGLGDRYSSALLNGSPLPSPEPLKRVVPLDLFPSSVIASSLVQKSYSPNFSGEFGGGVINLTTKAAPKEAFLTFGSSIGGDSQTTARLGYTYYGSGSDWTGFDDGSRNVPSALQAFFDSGKVISDRTVDQKAIISQLITPRNSLLQRNTQIPPNWGANIAGGKSFYVAGGTLGVVASAGYSNKWRTRDVVQQNAAALDLSALNNDFRRVITEDRIVINGLLGLSFEFEGAKIRWTNLYIRDTLKQARNGLGTIQDSAQVKFLQQSTAWFERQLINTQLAGEFQLTPELSLDLRGSYANSRREAPFEIDYTYTRTDTPSDPFGDIFRNTLSIGNSPGSANIAFSKLDENLYSAGMDLSYKIFPQVTTTIGYAYSDTVRVTDRRAFQFRYSGDAQILQGISLLRPDLLLSSGIVNSLPTGSSIDLIDREGGNPRYRATLQTNAGYFQLKAQITPEININAGVRYEDGKQAISPVMVYISAPTSLPPSTQIDKNYWLPAATLTYQINPKMQFRLSASKTIARPQFRELVFQTYYDPETNSYFRGNPQLRDSQLYNAEARYEWYFARDQRLSIGGFYKTIKNPVETYASGDVNGTITSFANAPKARLYGGEVEAQKYIDLAGLGENGFFSTRRAIIVANYTYSKSKLSVKDDDPVQAYPLSVSLARDLFRDGSPMTGQSDHLANLEIGLEDTGSLSQQTLLLSYASKRVTRRGPSGEPDIYEYPGFRLDFVAREAVRLAGVNTEIKFEVRNLTGTKYQEYQQSGANRVYYNRYNIGTSVSLGASVTF